VATRSRTLFLIFGLNRSGTSVLAGSLKRCGVALDFRHEGLEAGLRKEDGIRPDGGYESFEVPAILEFVRGVVERSGGHQINPVLSEELRFSATDALTVAALVRLIPSFPFAIKDPLLTFQYRQWKAAITASRDDVSVIPLVSLRPPLEQAYALLERGFCRSLRSGLDLWLRYYGEVRYLVGSGESPRIVLYDGREGRFLRQIEALCREFHLAYVETSIRSFFRPGPRRDRDPPDLEQHPLAAALSELYSDLESRCLVHAGPRQGGSGQAHESTF
jgi:hypothetical protein